MNKLFAAFYENWMGIFNQQYNLIFRSLYDGSGYFLLSLPVYSLSLLFLALFYLVWKYPYAKWWHWLLWLVFILVVIGGSTYGIFMQQIFQSNNPDLIAALYNPDTGYENFAYRVVWEYVQVNVFFAGVLGVCYSLLLKQISKIQKHLPF